MCIYCDLFQEGYALACGHVYHTACITTYADVAKLPMTHIRCPKCKRTSVDVEGVELDEDGALPHESGDMVEFLLGGRGSKSFRGTSSSSGGDTATVMIPQSPDIYVMNPPSQQSVPAGQPTQPTQDWRALGDVDETFIEASEEKDDDDAKKDDDKENEGCEDGEGGDEEEDEAADDEDEQDRFKTPEPTPSKAPKAQGKAKSKAPKAKGKAKSKPNKETSKAIGKITAKKGATIADAAAPAAAESEATAAVPNKKQKTNSSRTHAEAANGSAATAVASGEKNETVSSTSQAEAADESGATAAVPPKKKKRKAQRHMLRQPMGRQQRPLPRARKRKR